MSSSTETFWNEIYTKAPTRLPNEKDPVLVAALEFFGDVKGLRLLDLGCGEGRTSLFFASKGADIVSIDISEVAIQSLSDFCQQHNIKNISPLQCSAFEISKLGKFDLIFGSMILHHIEPFEKFSKTLNDTLNPRGKMFFYENNAFSALLMWFRTHVIGKYGIPKMGDDEEFPLTPGEVDLLRNFFQVEVIYPKLLFFQLASWYLFRENLNQPLKKLDDICFHIPALRRLSYRQYLLCQK